MKKLLTIIPFVILLCLVLATVSVNTVAAKKKERERFTGNVMGRSRGTSPRLNIIVDRWTTPEELKQLYNLTKDDDIKARFKAIRKKKAGHIWFYNERRFQINIASTTDTEKGRLIRLIIELPFLPGETETEIVARDQEFGAVDFMVSEGTEGKGYVYGRVTISINEDGMVGFRPLSSIRQVLNRIKKK